MTTYRVDQHEIQKPSKFVERPNGFEVTSNDGTMKIELRQYSILDGSMESSGFYTTMWIREGEGWIKVSNTQPYHTKEDFIKAISEVEEFTEAIKERRQSL